jgi:DivIVA domain-containing protein
MIPNRHRQSGRRGRPSDREPKEARVTSESSIERIRAAEFPLVRKGYDPGQVEAFLAKVADWLETGGTDQARAEVVKREIERVGERTASILASAEDTAQQLRGDAEREVAAMLDRAQSESTRVGTEADTYAATARSEADEYATRVRADADAYARKTRETVDADAERKQVVAAQRATGVIEAAEEKARRIVNDGSKRRREIEVVIADLVKHRDRVIATANGLGSELQSVAAGHTPEAGADPFERPHELDPLERGESVESEAESESESEAESESVRT